MLDDIYNRRILELDRRMPWKSAVFHHDLPVLDVALDALDARDFAPFRALVGFRSDTHRSVLGWRRVPYIWFGTLLQFGGLAIMPFALLILSGDTTGPVWPGHVAAALAFVMVGAGLHTTQTVGLALATDLAPAHARPRVVALLCADAVLLQGRMDRLEVTLTAGEGTTWVLVGTDSRSALPAGATTSEFGTVDDVPGSRADVVLVVHESRDGTTAFSVPRDLLVPQGALPPRLARELAAMGLL